MRSSEATTSSLRVWRLRAEYLIAAEHPSPQSLRARLDETIEKVLPQTLATHLTPLAPTDDPSLCFIRRLELDVSVNAVAETERTGEVWAAQFTRALASEMEADETSGNVVRFADRAAYLAQFLCDLADGCAWGKWFYRSFAGLRMLPLSAALRTALCGEPAGGLAALRQLEERAAAKVLQGLTEQDALRVFEMLADGTDEMDEADCFRVLAATWKVFGSQLSALEEHKAALRLYLLALREKSDRAGRTLQRAARALSRLSRCLRESSGARREQLLAALHDGAAAKLFIIVAANDANPLLPLLCCPPEVLRAFGDAHGQVRTPETTSLATPFGGVFLLLPLLAELPLAAATRGWAGHGDHTAETLARWLLLIKCGGRERAAQVCNDALLRELLGIAPAFTLPDLIEWQAAISPAQLARFAAEMEAHQRMYGTVGGETLLLVATKTSDGRVAVLFDCARGCWLFIGDYDPRRPQRLIERLRERCASAASCRVLLCDQIFVNSLRVALPTWSVVNREDEDAALGQTAAVETLARVGQTNDDLNYLSLPVSMRRRRDVDFAFSVAAQHVMRAFAWRLPGFAHSGLPYLHRNFLDFAGSVEIEPARRVVRLGRPPLHLVLSLTGMTRQTYRLSWLDDYPLALFQET